MTHFADVGKMLLEVAPGLSSLFFSPYAKIAFNLLTKAIGMHYDSTPCQVSDAIKNGSEELIAKVKMLEATHSTWMMVLSSLKPSHLTVTLDFSFQPN